MSKLDWCLAVPAALFFVLLFISCSVVMRVTAEVHKAFGR